MTKDEVLRLFHKEIASEEHELNVTESEMLKLRLMKLNNPIIFERKLEELYIKKIILEDRVKALCNSRDKLVEVMVDEYL